MACTCVACVHLLTIGGEPIGALLIKYGLGFVPRALVDSGREAVVGDAITAIVVEVPSATIYLVAELDGLEIGGFLTGTGLRGIPFARNHILQG